MSKSKGSELGANCQQSPCPSRTHVPCRTYGISAEVRIKSVLTRTRNLTQIIAVYDLSNLGIKSYKYVTSYTLAIVTDDDTLPHSSASSDQLWKTKMVGGEWLAEDVT